MYKHKLNKNGRYTITPRRYKTKYGVCNVVSYIGWDEVIVKFVNTGYITTARADDLRNNSVKDYLYPTILGIGYLGEEFKTITDSSLRMKVYKVWTHMLSRCYDKHNKGYNNYGNKGVTVCKQWHCFTNFFYDFIRLPGYSRQKLMHPVNKLDKITLDKDILQAGMSKRDMVYSYKTCCLVNCLTQKQYTTGITSPKQFIAIHPDGTETIELNISQFSTANDLSDKAVSACVLGTCKSHKGYKFKPYK